MQFRIERGNARERVVVTKFVQQLLDKGWTVRLALQHLKEMNIPEEKLALVRGEDLRIPDVIDVGPDGDKGGGGASGDGSFK